MTRIGALDRKAAGQEHRKNTACHDLGCNSLHEAKKLAPLNEGALSHFDGLDLLGFDQFIKIGPAHTKMLSRFGDGELAIFKREHARGII